MKERIKNGGALVLTSFGFGPTAAASWQENRTASLPVLGRPPPNYSHHHHVSRRLLSIRLRPRNLGSRMDAAGGAEAAANGGIEGSADPCSSGGYRLSVYQIAGGGKAADIILWRRGRVTIGVIFGATMAWWLFEKSGLSLLTICCDIFLILIVLQFLRVKIAGLLNRQPRPLPELVLSEEMVSNAAASFRVKVNNMLRIAHDITLGKDFRLLFQVVLALWLLSVIGNFCSSITLAYIGTIALVTIPALYNKYQRTVDRYAGMVHRNISRHYKIVDENVISRLPRRFIRDKED